LQISPSDLLVSEIPISPFGLTGFIKIVFILILYQRDSMVSSVREASMRVIPESSNRYVSLRNASGILGFNQPPISLSEFVRKDIPIDWPLGDGDYKAGFDIVTDIPVSSKIGFLPHPASNKAIIYYPSMKDGQNVQPATDGSFPLIVFGHAKRYPSASVCPGSDTDITQDFMQMRGLCKHMAKWGFVTICPDLSWLWSDGGDPFNRAYLLEDAITYVRNLPSLNSIINSDNAAMGHSTGGSAAIILATHTRDPHSPYSFGKYEYRATSLIAPALPDWPVTMTNLEPVLIFCGTIDTGEDGTNGQPLKIYAKAGAKKHLVTINGANHFGYTDAICLLPNADGTAYLSQVNQQRIAKAYIIAFFRRYLKGVLAMDPYLP
jgi:dienelactone hydrolase